MKKCKSNLLVLALIFTILDLIGCQQNKPKAKESTAKEVIPVKAMMVKTADVRQTLDYVGNIEANNEAIIYPKVSGKVIEKLKQENTPIKKDEIIIFIDRDEVGLKFEKAPVVSTLDGMVGKLFVDIGQRVSPSTPVALVMDIEKVKIKLDLPEKYSTQLQLGLKAFIKVDASPKDLEGELTKVIPVVDPSNRTLPIEISVKNSDYILKPGMYAQVRLILKEFKNTPVVIKEAILNLDSQPQVYVIENNKAKLRTIQLGLKEGPFYQVISGLKEGELVVIMGQEKLFENAEVKVEIEENYYQEN